jgi:hypothetical protein
MKTLKDKELIVVCHEKEFIGIIETKNRHETLEILKQGIKNQSFAYWNMMGITEYLKRQGIEVKPIHLLTIETTDYE